MRKKIKIYVSVFLLVTCLLSLVTVSYAEAPERIISLAPGITEILFAAGLGDNIVGVTNFCDYPEEAKQKPKIGGMSNPSLEAVVSLEPDIVVMTTDGNPKEFEQKLRRLQIDTHVFEALTLDELPEGIRKIGDALDERDRFNRLALNIERSIDRFKDRGRETNPPLPPLAKGGRGGISNSELRTPNSELQKKVLFVIWPEPLIAAGPKTAVDDAIKLLGLTNIAGQTKSRYPKYSIEEILRQSPDIIFFGRGRGMDEISGRLLKRLSSVPAVKNRKVFYVSDSLYRLGPRVIGGLEELAGHLTKEVEGKK